MRCKPGIVGIIAVAALAATGCGDGPMASGATMKALASSPQSGPAGGTLLPYRVELRDDQGKRAKGVSVEWSVVSGGGSIAPASSVTDDQGVAEASATLGTMAGIQRVTAEASGYAGSPIAFEATITAAPPALISKTMGDNQAAAPGTLLPGRLGVRVTDQYDNPVIGLLVSWGVTLGDGAFSKSKTRTDATGNASVSFTLDSVPGVHTITASAGTAGRVAFTETGTVTVPAPRPHRAGI